jgi:transposase
MAGEQKPDEAVPPASPSSGAGRPSKLTPEVETRFIAALRTGAYRAVAASWCGIGERTVRDWMRAGREEPDSEFGTFRRKVIEAEAAAEIEVGTSLYRGIKGRPDLELKYMQLRYRGRWKLHDRVELTGKGGGPVQHQQVPPDLSALNDTELDSLETLLAKATRRDTDETPDAG